MPCVSRVITKHCGMNYPSRLESSNGKSCNNSRDEQPAIRRNGSSAARAWPNVTLDGRLASSHDVARLSSDLLGLPQHEGADRNTWLAIANNTSGNGR